MLSRTGQVGSECARLWVPSGHHQKVRGVLVFHVNVEAKHEFVLKGPFQPRFDSMVDFVNSASGSTFPAVGSNPVKGSGEPRLGEDSIRVEYSPVSCILTPAGRGGTLK